MACTDIDLLNSAYVVWVDYGSEGWQPYGFSNLHAALIYEKHEFEWLITKHVKFEAVEKE